MIDEVQMYKETIKFLHELECSDDGTLQLG
jgi:hypothetical protein